MSEPRNHHYLPQCYLLGFVRHRTKPKLFVTDTRTRKSFSTHPRNLGAVRDFNRIEIDGVDPNAVEAGYAHFESELAPALVRIEKAGAITSAEDWNLVYNLISLTAIRNPRWRRQFAAFQGELVRKAMQAVTSSEAAWRGTTRGAVSKGYLEPADADRFEEMQAFVRSNEYDVETPTTTHVSLEMDAVDYLLPLMGRRLWTQVRAPRDHPFVTSDHPVCLYLHADRDALQHVPIGFGLKGTEVLFPVNSSLAIAGSFEDDAPRDFDAEPESVAWLNGRIISQAERQIFARDSGFRYSVDQNRQMRRGPELLNDQSLGRFAQGHRRT